MFGMGRPTFLPVGGVDGLGLPCCPVLLHQRWCGAATVGGGPSATSPPPPPAARWLNDDLVGARPAAAAASGTSGRWGAPTAAWTTSASCPTAASPPTWPARRWRTTPPGAEPRATRPSRWSVGAAPDPVQSLRTLERRRLPRTEPRCDGSAPVYCAPTSAPPWLPHSSR